MTTVFRAKEVMRRLMTLDRRNTTVYSSETCFNQFVSGVRDHGILIVKQSALKTKKQEYSMIQLGAGLDKKS